MTKALLLVKGACGGGGMKTTAVDGGFIDSACSKPQKRKM